MQPRPEASALAPGPSLGSRAPLPSSPQWSGPGSALRQERGREGSSTTGAHRTPPGRWRRRRRQRGSRPGPRPPPRLLPPRNLGSEGDNHHHNHPPGNSRDILEWDEGPPRTAQKGEASPPTPFHFPSFQVCYPTPCLSLISHTLFPSPRALSTLAADPKMELSPCSLQPQAFLLSLRNHSPTSSVICLPAFTKLLLSS